MEMEEFKKELVYSNLDYLSFNVYSTSSKFEDVYSKYKQFLETNDLSTHLYDDNYFPISDLFPSLSSFKNLFFKFYVGKYPYSCRLLFFYRYKNMFHLVSVIYFSDDFNEKKTLDLLNGDISFAGNVFIELKGQFFYFDRFLKYQLTDFLQSFLDIYTESSIRYLKYNRIDFCFDFFTTDKSLFNSDTFNFFDDILLLKNRVKDFSVVEKSNSFVGYTFGSKNHQYFSVVSYFKTERNLLYTAYLSQKQISLNDVQRIEFRIFKDFFRKRNISNSVHYLNIYESIYVFSLDILKKINEFSQFVDVYLGNETDFFDDFNFYSNSSVDNHFIEKEVKKNFSKELKRIISSIASFVVKYNLKINDFVNILLKQIEDKDSHFRIQISKKRKKLYGSLIEIFSKNSEYEVFFEEEDFL